MREFQLTSSRDISLKGIRFFAFSAMGPAGKGSRSGWPVTTTAGAGAGGDCAASDAVTSEEGSVSSVASSPMYQGSSCFHAFLEWMASNSSVVSVPALMVMLSAPPGCSGRYLVASYTFPATTIHTSSSLSCSSTSAILMNRLPLASTLLATTAFGAFFASTTSAAAATGTATASSAGGLYSPTKPPIQPPDLNPGSVGCSKCSTLLPSGRLIWLIFTVNCALLPKPKQFQDMWLGCVLFESSHARHLMLLDALFTSLEMGTAKLQMDQHQNLAWRLGAAQVTLASSH
mmetsp:Transcript_44397/g.82922  ORF Transcript_44397/g.82922 Transcript_44397/m.82922 type:complete len:288 (+) Transcript_44397:2779-3642(+)